VFDPGLPFGHRRAAFVRDGRRYIPARFAIDWIRLDAQGWPWAGDARKPFERWHGWGQDVFAVADGEIVAVRDGRDDVMASDLPANRWTDDDVAGNYVGLAIPGGRFVFYEHLQRGSIVVAAGERVKAGQAIGRVGRSGVNSSGPHLHLHMADAPSTLHAQGRPYAFTGFRPLGSYGSMDEAQGGNAWVARPAAAAARMQRELPSPNTVLMFDEPGASTMYGLIGKMVAKPGQRDALIAILLESVGTMPGCRSYVVARDPGNEQAIWITEVWDNEASHKASLQLPGVKSAIQRAMPLIQGFEQHQVTEPVGGHGLGA
jgi:quinol monooxygenase YgiN